MSEIDPNKGADSGNGNDAINGPPLAGANGEGTGAPSETAPAESSVATAERPQTSPPPESSSPPPANGNGNGNGHKTSTFNFAKFLGGHTKEKPSSEKTEDGSWEDELHPPKPPRFAIWRGLEGLAVMAFGVVIPALMLAATAVSMPKRLTLVVLNHPVETVVEIMLMLLVPMTNFALWSALRKDDVRFGLKRGIALGSAIVTSLAVAAFGLAARINGGRSDLESEMGTSFESGFTWLFMLCMLAAAASGYIVYSFRKTRDFAKSRNLIVAYTAIGAILTLCTVAGAEVKIWYLRFAERMAVSSKVKERAEGLTILKQYNPERELRMQCSDQRAAGFSGLFFPVKPNAEKELYFAMTGKPFSFHDGTNEDLGAMPDDYVSRHAVGDREPGLSLVRSLMTNAVHPDTLSSTVKWTFVLKNEGSYSSTARAEIGLPPGAVVTGLTEWINGEQKQGAFTATGKAKTASEQWNASSAPAMISDLGHGRVLIHVSPVNPDAEMKIGMTMVVPLKPDGPKTASLLLPKVIASNFSLGDENGIKLYSPIKLESGFSALKPGKTNDGVQTLSGQVEGKQLESSEVVVTVQRPESSSKPFAVLDKLAVKLAQEEQRRLEELRKRNHGDYTPLPQQLVVMVDGRNGIKSELDALASQFNQRPKAQKPRIKTVKPEYVVQSIAKVKSPAPKQLVVVLDGSQSLRSHVGALKQALSSIPQNVPVRMMIASQDNAALNKDVNLANGLNELSEKNFSGGQNNLKTVIDATEIAGASKGGAVLWIHGPQPVSSGEMYITTPYAAHPAFYELPVDSGEIDTSEFFKNHTDIGPFMQVSHNATLEKDVDCFLAKWKPDAADYTVALSHFVGKPDVRELPADQAQEVLQLHAYNQCMALLNEKKPRTAAKIAVAYGLVTPVSCSLVADESQLPNNNNSEQTQNQNNEQTSDQLSSSENGENTGQLASAPQIQGATNGTIGPQGADATYVIGLNTSGSVRVNNLANLEALLNILANGCEIGLGLGGIILFISGFIPAAGEKTLAPGRMWKRVAIGATIVIIGLAVPGTINWFVASARDANLFN